jgi:flagellar hook-basal body complex protein FliE
MPTSAFAAGAYAAAQSVGASSGLGGLNAARRPQGAEGGAFGSLLASALDSVAVPGKKAETQAMAVAGGKADVVDVVTAVAESEAALETLVAVRDRVISAYEDIMRMPI